MTDLKKDQINSIDCILDIRGTHTALIRRKNNPFKGFWALPGGRQKDGETIDDAIVRELSEEICPNIKVISKNIPYLVDIEGEKAYLHQIWTYGSGNDPRGGNVTVYSLKVNQDPKHLKKSLKAGSDALEVKIFSRKNLPQLAFEQNMFINDYFNKLSKYRNPIPATDIIIEHEGKIVLIERKNPPFGLALPGGFCEYGLTLEENAVKEGKEETNLNVILENPGHPYVYSSPDRDPRAHIISNTYYAKGYGVPKAGDDAKSLIKVTPSELKSLIKKNLIVFDHPRIIMDWLMYRGYEK